MTLPSSSVTLMGMSSRLIRTAACAFLLASLTACSQSDGPLPTATGDVPNRLGDLAKDLQNVAGGDKEAPKDLADDLAVFVMPAAEPAARDLATKTATALIATKLTQPASQKIANQLWVAVAATQFSDKQRQSLQDDTKADLVAAGATQANAQASADAIGNVQKLVNKRKRRWYELR